MADKIAVIGIAGRYPEADTPDELFKNLIEGRNSLRKISPHELGRAGVSKEKIESGDFRAYGSKINGYKRFDNKFFNMTQLESELTDPQQRIFLECCYQALQDAGYGPTNIKEKVGVFGSESRDTYLLNNLVPSDYYRPDHYDYPIILGNDVDSLATRVSYKLGLTGPSLSIQSGCSSSLVALNYAIHSVQTNECNMALVGGVSLTLPENGGYFYTKGSTFSNSGKVSPFDQAADGMVISSGCSIVIIKKLDDAIQDHDHIYGVIDGLGINNDGKQKIGYTAPSVKGQTEAIQMALEQAEITPSDVFYVETHGTGTKIGDPIEIRAISKNYGQRNDSLRIGSIKANIGHLDAAAGITGLIKDLLILKYKIIPQQINYHEMNTNIDSNNNCIQVDVNNKRLDGNDKHYLAFTSLGIGGTNVHGIVSEYKALNGGNSSVNDPVFIPITAVNEQYLNQLVIKIGRYVAEKLPDIHDISYTLGSRVEKSNARIYLYARDNNEILQQIKSYLVKGESNYGIFPDGDKWIDSGKVSAAKKLVCNGNRISLPYIHFLGEECWIEPESDLHKLKKEVTPNSHEDMLSMVKSIWQRNMGQAVSDDDEFTKIGGESLVAVSIIGELSSRLNLELDPNMIQNYNTPRKIADFLILGGNPSEIAIDMGNVVLIHEGNSPTQLFLIHPAGGSLFCYEKLLANLKTNITVWGISFPRTISAETTIQDLAPVYAKQIEKLISNESEVIVGGYSFGGNEALAVADVLKHHHVSVNEAVLIDSIVPEAYSTVNLTKKDYIDRFPQIWKFITGDASDGKFCKNVFLNLDEAIRWGRIQGIVSDKLPDAIVKRMFQVWTSNHKVLSNQVLKKKQSINITLLYADEKLPENLYSFTSMKPYEPNEWAKYCQSISTIHLKGNHYTIFGDPKKLLNLKKEFQKILNNLEVH
ncbi:beta-ketoacyl synthase N-terminal-like domain-containing protein [Latilactobacillus sakei]|uniref:beta-ketoacyl synthase N-terminal-like domain-containing protein n=1 Tax=Latilactobacillus sakei TaxID=1599 RepID=UPI00202F00F6|nr:beta-ketoacyl synthase N-terminal-like domain-containing protein [Latilactobacillus sakei]MCM1635771.1 thioesterase domain-containing protein [Latilactobacillus sakei]